MRAIAPLMVLAMLAAARGAAAEEPAAAGASASGEVALPKLNADGSTAAPPPTSTLPEPPPEAPPPLPRKKGLVLDAALGALGFGGQFRHVAPPGPWAHAQLGYELLDWLMLFGEGEIMFTDTSEAQDATKSRAFDVFGFGGGVRGTIRPTPRLGLYLQVSIDALKADVPKGALAILGFRDAEGLNPAFGGRLGAEWYQVDRHFALGIGIGLRDATGFAKLAQKSDTGLLWDASASIRYTF